MRALAARDIFVPVVSCKRADECARRDCGAGIKRSWAEDWSHTSRQDNGDIVGDVRERRDHVRCDRPVPFWGGGRESAIEDLRLQNVEAIPVGRLGQVPAGFHAGGFFRRYRNQIGLRRFVIWG